MRPIRLADALAVPLATLLRPATLPDVKPGRPRKAGAKKTKTRAL